MKNLVLLLLGLVVVLILLKRVSGFDETIFAQNMTLEEAEKLYHESNTKIQTELGRRLPDVQNNPALAQKLGNEAADATNKLTDAYNVFLKSKGH
jgi:hypothetical protein